MSATDVITEINKLPTGRSAPRLRPPRHFSPAMDGAWPAAEVVANAMIARADERLTKNGLAGIFRRRAGPTEELERP